MTNDNLGTSMSRDAFNGEGGDVRYYNPQLNTLHTDRVWPEKVDSFRSFNVYPYLHPHCIQLLRKHLAKEKNRVCKKGDRIIKEYLEMVHTHNSVDILDCVWITFALH